ncbi:MULTISPECIES: hypothetical protein [Streptosporangium]|uniref:Mu-like prophage FluMu N-terminal domain-containing protein n=1 Tax=Streptosporangium brasiliense TaxID=47480 RepID=A0ABT9RK78_9ACTN|nr:hypothetical protein [Streptosporangium brasiliense]MDP9869226.1 hypothetical protein [Streptosporangium brasiliense]
MGMLTVKANAPVLGMRDGRQYDIADSPFIRKVIESRKLTLLADHSFVEENWSDGPASADDQEQAADEAAPARKTDKQ